MDVKNKLHTMKFMICTSTFITYSIKKNYVHIETNSWGFDVQGPPHLMFFCKSLFCVCKFFFCCLFVCLLFVCSVVLFVGKKKENEMQKFVYEKGG